MSQSWGKLKDLAPSAKHALAAAGSVVGLAALTSDDRYSPGVLDIMINQLTESTEEKDLRFLIRNVLREYTINQPNSLHPAKPNAYQFYSPPIADSEAEESDKTYDEYAVIVPGDAGVSTYSVRPTNESELRDMIKNLLLETKKKVRKSQRKK